MPDSRDPSKPGFVRHVAIAFRSGEASAEEATAINGDRPYVFVAKEVPEGELRQKLREQEGEYLLRAKPNGEVCAVCNSCNVPLDVAQQDELVWLRCPLCRRVSFNPIWNVERDVQFAVRDGEAFEYEQYYVRRIPPGLMHPFLHEEDVDLAAAEAQLREEIDLLRRTDGARDPRFPEALDTLAEFLLETGRFADAIALSREALAARPRGHPGGVRSINNLASAYARLGDQRTAGALAREALALQHATVGKGHPNTITTLANIAESLRAQSRHADAEPVLREVVELAARHPEKADRGFLVGLLVELIAVHDRLGNWAAAEADVRRLLGVLREHVGGDERAVAAAVERLVEGYSEIEPGAAALLRANAPRTAL